LPQSLIFSFQLKYERILNDSVALTFGTDLIKMMFEIWYPNLTIKIYAIFPMTLFFKFKHIISNSYTDNSLFETG